MPTLAALFTIYTSLDMILNNATNENISWKVSNVENSEQGTKSYDSWGTITPPAGPFDYTVTMGTATANNVENPDACCTYNGKEILVTYPGA